MKYDTIVPSFRWYGSDDRVSLAWIKQMTPTPKVVTAIYDVPPGELWSAERVGKLKTELDEYGLEFGPIESLPLSQAVKLALPERDRHIENYILSLKNLAAVGVTIVTYNTMVLDWSRSELAHLLPNGARCLAFDQQAVEAIDLSHGLFLPGWSERIEKRDFDLIRSRCSELGEEGMWENIRYFLSAVVPEAEKLGITLAVHPNDPPWSTFGFPALLVNTPSIRRHLSLVDSPANALCFCTGSYSANPENDLLQMIKEFKDRTSWMHIRTTKTTGYKQFHEADHAADDANVDVFDIAKAVVASGFSGVYRSDHAFDMLYETELGMNGYGAIGRYAANQLLYGYFRGLSTN